LGKIFDKVLTWQLTVPQLEGIWEIRTSDATRSLRLKRSEAERLSRFCNRKENKKSNATVLIADHLSVCLPNLVGIG